MIRRLVPDDWQAFRAIRLEALRLDPAAFLSTLAREEPFTEADWRGRLTTAAVFAACDPEPQGLAGLLPDGCVVMVYVRAAARGQGLAVGLMQAVQAEARAKRMDRIWLHVAPDNGAAQRLYERLGYEVEGKDGTDIVLSRTP